RIVLRGAASRLPLLAVGGTRDPFAEDTVALWSGWGGPARLLLGPWGHRLTADRTEFAADRVNLGALYVRWAHAALAGALAPERRGVITLGGSGRWHRVRQGAARGPGEASTRTTTWAFDAPTGLRLLHGAEFTADPVRPVRSDDLAVP
ncbi:peptidase S15, partial [Streptomyces sp. MBT57]|nr:peptidase S15 [Streptomyces sp. MBT57]